MMYHDVFKILPILLVASGIIITLIAEMFFGKKNIVIPAITFVVTLAAAYYSLFTVGEQGIFFNGMLAAGGLVNIFYFLFNFGAAVVVLLSAAYTIKIGIDHGEYYIILLSAVLGMMLIAGAKDLVVVFIGLELMSVAFYILAGFRRKDSKSNEAGLKYFLLGAFATGFIVYGMAFIYGANRSLALDSLLFNMPALIKSPFFLIGVLLFTVGFTFKIAAFPFHMWVPDVYQGAPTSVTALMSTTGKTAAFSALFLLFIPIAVHGGHKVFAPFLAVFSTCTMLYGSIVALAQNDVKRMLAYSSIAHAGYMLIGLASGNISGVAGVIFYLTAYTFMNLGAFGVISMLESADGAYLSFEDYEGLGFRQPTLAAFLSLFLFALSGIPPFAGFFGKYYVFIAAIQGDMTWLAIIGVLSSVISVYFYLRLTIVMYFKQNNNPKPIIVSQLAFLGILISALLVIILGIAPGAILNLITTFS